MVLVALLLLSGVCLVFGLATQNGTWLIASLIATVGAAYLLLRSAPSIRRRGARTAADGPDLPSAAPSLPPASVVPASPVAPAPVAPAPVAPAPVAPAPVAPPAYGPPPTAPQYGPPPTVPQYGPPQYGPPHYAPPPQAPSQQYGPPAQYTPPTEPCANPGDVLVIDGRPHYHRRECEQLVGQFAEPIPLEQATEDGLQRCTLCEPPTAPEQPKSRR